MATRKIQPCHLGNAPKYHGSNQDSLHVWSTLSLASHVLPPPKKKRVRCPLKLNFSSLAEEELTQRYWPIKLSNRKKIRPNTHQAIKFQRPLGWVFQHFNLSTHTEAPHPPTPLRVYAQLRQPTKARKLRLGAPVKQNPLGCGPLFESLSLYSLSPFPFLLMVEICLKSTSTIVYGEIAKYLTFQVVLFGISEASTVSTQNSPSLYS